MVGRVEGWLVSLLVNWEVFPVFWLWVELINIEGTVVIGLPAGLATIVADVVANVELFT